jgi:hypothetical protein
MSQTNTVQNILNTKEQCPSCRLVFISGYDVSGIKVCPSCGFKFKVSSTCQPRSPLSPSQNIAPMPVLSPIRAPTQNIAPMPVLSPVLAPARAPSRAPVMAPAPVVSPVRPLAPSPAPVSACGKYAGTNNVYYRDGCPALMSDGRFITYYNSTNELTEAMRKMNGFKSPNEFRTFMQNNADKIMDAERSHIIRQNTCSPTTACSEGWNDLWTQHGGDWTNTSQ